MTVKILLTLADQDSFLVWLEKRICSEDIRRYSLSRVTRQDIIMEYLHFIAQAVDPETGAWRLKYPPVARAKIIEVLEDALKALKEE